MQTIGERLEEARKRKGISVREAAEATKIRSDYLHKLESNSFDLNLPEIYVRGFLRGYASYLKLNGDKLLADYSALAPNEGRAARRDTREIYGRMDLGQTVRPAEEAPPAPPPAPETPAPPPPPARPSFPAATGSRGIQINPAVLVKAGIVAAALLVVVVMIFGIRALSRGPSRSTVELKAVPAQMLTLAATGPVDVQIRDDLDGPIIWRGHMDAGDRHTINKRGTIYLTATRLENIQIDIDGRKVANPYSGYNRVQIP